MEKTPKVFLATLLAASVALGSIPVTAAGHQPASVTQQHENKIVSYAKSLAGIPYKAAGTTKKGFDASGYIQHVYQQFGIKLPRTSKDLFKYGEKTSSLQPGDLVFYDTKNKTKKEVSYVGIYIGNHKFIAVTVSKGVSVQNMNDKYWKEKYVGATKIPIKKQ